MNVYEGTNFIGRVDLAAAYIAAGRNSSRTFDTCFEMHDGGAVTTALVRRARANPTGRLAANLFKYIGEERAIKTADSLAHIPTSGLKTIAAEMRHKAKVEFKAFMASRI